MRNDLLAIDLFCGLGGWTEGLLAEGYRVIGFDIEARPYPAQLVLQDVLTVHGSQFRNVALIVASPPCQAYSYRAMPWKRAKALPPPSNELWEACFRIQREACEAAGRHIPMVVENVKGAQPWVGRAKWHYGSFYLWGDVPALMPFARHRKVPGMNFHEHEKTGMPGRSFQSAAVELIKNDGGSWFNIGSPGQTETNRNPVHDGVKVPGIKLSEVGFNVAAAQRYRAERDGVKQHGSGAEWFDNGLCRKLSRSDSRKAASAQIAKIPLPLAQHIARVYSNVEAS